jgi:DNA-binding MarR family transcriptional regulator
MRKDTLINRDFFFALQKSLFVFDKSAEHTLRQEKMLTLAQFHVLVTLSAMGTVSQQAVAEILQNTQASISRQVAILLRKKLINRVQNLKNKREYKLSCTPLGIAEVKHTMNTLDNHFETIFAVLAHDEKKGIITALKRLVQEVKKSQGIDSCVFERMNMCEVSMKDNLRNL